MGLYRCPYPPFPFPTYYPDTGTGSARRNRNSVCSCLQPLTKRSLQCLTQFHIKEIHFHLRKPQHEQNYQQDDYGYR